MSRIEWALGIALFAAFVAFCVYLARAPVL